MTCLVAEKSSALSGEVILPGDKSISHRALILGTLARGTTLITGLLEGSDVMATADALKQLGSIIERADNGIWSVHGIGLNAFVEPQAPLDLGNSGTGVRLLMGAVAGAGISSVFTGDASLSARPMGRIIDPLTLMGARITARDGARLPLTVVGSKTPVSIEYESPHASAQIKSAILLAGLTARGITKVIEPRASRDHTETLLRHFGVEVVSEPLASGGICISLKGEVDLHAANITVPSDPSSAAFLAVAALITEGSALTIKGVGTNPLRFGIFETLIEMGADIKIANQRFENGEPIADLEIASSRLKGVDVPSVRAASMIDEYPILSVAAAFAQGTTTMTGVGELRVKETDRIAVMQGGLERAGVEVSSTTDSMTIKGGTVKGGISVDACHDHRIAMSFLVLGLATTEAMSVSGAETIATSFPNFVSLMQSAGAHIREVEA